MFLIWLTYVLAYLYRCSKTKQNEEKDVLLDREEDDTVSLEDWIMESHPIDPDEESTELNRHYGGLTRRVTI
jgi:hypothetical protein